MTNQDPILSQNREGMILSDLRQLIAEARQRVAVTANATITLLYWHIGERINREVLNNKRAEYGKTIVDGVAQQLTLEYGKGFDSKSLRRMMQFADMFPDLQIVATLSRQLSWSHFKEVIPMLDAIQREFYLTMAAEERWSVRTLRAKIDGMLFERTAIASKPEELIRAELATLREEHAITPESVFKICHKIEICYGFFCKITSPLRLAC